MKSRWAWLLLAALLAGCGGGVRAEAPAPPDIKPYKLPTLSGAAVDYHTTPALDRPDPRPDFDAVFSLVMACYPMPSLFNVEVEAQAVANTSRLINLDNTTAGRYYLQIVAKMPLYSSSEIDRVTQREGTVREKLAQDVGQFFEALSQAKLAHRLLGLYSSLESRSQARVQAGLADTIEQVGFLKDTAEAQANVTKWDTASDALRVRLASYCRETERENVSGYLGELQREESNK